MRRAARYLVGLAIFAGLALGVAELQAEITRVTTAGSSGGGTTVTSGSGISVDGGVVSLASTAVDAGSYTYASITVDQQGRLTGASSGATPALVGSANTFTAANTVAVDDATNSGTTTLQTLRHTTSGTAASGIGALLAYETEDGAGNVQATADTAAILSTVTNGSEKSFLRFRGLNGSAVMTAAAEVWGSQRVYFGQVSATEPSATVHAKSESSVAAATPALILDKDRAAATGNVYLDMYRQGASKANLALTSGDLPILTVGSATYTFGTNGFLTLAAASLSSRIELTQTAPVDTLTATNNSAGSASISLNGSNNLKLGAGSNTTTHLVLYGDGKRVTVGGRFGMSKGADVAAANDLTLGVDGNVFVITGNTQINHIVSTNWQAGSVLTLIFSGTPTVKTGQATSGANTIIRLAGAVDFSATANDVLTLVYDGTSFLELARSVN